MMTTSASHIDVVPAAVGDGVPQPTLDPVALGGVADPLGDRRPTRRPRPIALAQTSLDRHPLRMKAAARGRRDEVRSFRQTPDSILREARASGDPMACVTPTGACGHGRGEQQ